MKSIAVFCGSSSGTNEIFAQQAYALGKTLAGRGIRLVYGGAKVGLMGAVADGVLDHGGHAIGVLPAFLRSKEIAHEKLSELIIVETMHERKTKMNELSEGVIALPGGFGTLEEFFEMLTWAQLGLHKKPVAVLNTGGFYDALFALMHNMVGTGFLKPVNHDMVLFDEDADTLIGKMQQYEAPVVAKWIKKDEV